MTKKKLPLPVCLKCKNICRVEEDWREETQSYYPVSDCCGWSVTFYDDIKEVMLLNLENEQR
jgi:hypothetical protein